MARYYIVVGDTTTVGGEVLQGHTEILIQGLAQVFVGDLVRCGQCGTTQVATGSSGFVDDRGRHAALDADALACGHQLVSIRQRHSSESG
ncbi:PAAR domain-containing protein [Lysobacter sp. FW306-1B-D06B]|uniref:PAAR domain-containing protein n=1 Tax=Lysobacter sp. FW306-1B-D06B TaxID=3140250 RepID=UPI0031409081